MSPRVLAGVATIAAVAFADAAHAALSCSSSATSIVFGNYDPFAAAPLASTGTVSMSCTLVFPSSATKITYTIALSAGNSGSMIARAMFSGPNFLRYNIFTTNAYAQIWGDGSGGTATVTGSMKLGSPGEAWSQTANHVMYGRVFAVQDALPGNYSDTIIVTVTY